jgi:hypothetical protein
VHIEEDGEVELIWVPHMRLLLCRHGQIDGPDRGQEGGAGCALCACLGDGEASDVVEDARVAEHAAGERHAVVEN